MAEYPVTFDVRQPEKFDRAHVVIRLLIVIILSALAGSVGWIPGLVYLGIPVLAAVLISQKGATGYLADADKGMIRWLHYLVGFYAYLALLTDKLPGQSAEEDFIFKVSPGGQPTTGGALLRIILAIPSALVLALLWLVGTVLALIAAVMVVFQESYPAQIYNFLRGLIRWEARLLAYLASLVEEYPPYSLETEESQTPSAPTLPAAR